MKKMIILVAILSLVVAGIAYASVLNSKHDLSSTATTQQVCVFCHHPHGVKGSQNDLLWNISDSVASYDTYGDSGTTTSGITGANATKAQTTLCMGCHDGDGGANTFRKPTFDGQLTGTVDGSLSLGSYANLGETLSDDHPVGFTYPDASWTAFGDLKAKEDAEAGDPSDFEVTGASTNAYPLYGTSIASASMECATCHDVHAGNNTADTSTTALQFMRGNTVNSQICIDCHTTK